jgi:drug/metabolite transporter (DMT)-like permease
LIRASIDPHDKFFEEGDRRVGALAFILWVMALERATPTRVAATMTVNPLAAGLLATQLVGEPITPNLVVGLAAVFAGIWIATTEAKKS